MALDESSSVLLNGRELQVTKVTAEDQQVFEGKRLPAEQEHLVLVPRGAHGMDLVGSEHPQIRTANLRTDRRVQTTVRRYGYRCAGDAGVLRLGVWPCRSARAGWYSWIPCHLRLSLIHISE